MPLDNGLIVYLSDVDVLPITTTTTMMMMLVMITMLAMVMT